jgi:hypothetical protein
VPLNLWRAEQTFDHAVVVTLILLGGISADLKKVTLRFCSDFSAVHPELLAESTVTCPFFFFVKR